MEEHYTHWVAERKPPLFGVRPDSKILELAATLGPTATLWRFWNVTVTIKGYRARVPIGSDRARRSSRVPSGAGRTVVWIGAVYGAIALTTGELGCGGGNDGIAPPAGLAEVLPDGSIVLAGCPRDLIDTRETYEISTPSGSCQPGANRCQVHTQQWCPGGIQGPLFDWACDCVNGEWNCEMPARAMEYCPALPNNPPTGDSQRCAYDPARRQGIECQGDVTQCEVTTIQQCPGGGQGRTSRWVCGCNAFAMLAPTVRVWDCEREPSETRACAANSCPVIASYSVNSTRASVGERVELRASVRDDDADDLTVRWSTTLGRFINPHTPNTGYTCTEAGTAKLTFVVADGGCETTMNVDVECR